MPVKILATSIPTTNLKRLPPSTVSSVRPVMAGPQKISRTLGVAHPGINQKKILQEELKLLSLPESPKERNSSIGDYTLLIYGREKIGKTTVLASFPESIFFTTEPGTKGLSIFEFNSEGGGVKSWDYFLRGVELIEQNKTKFKTVIIDTVDRAYDMCLDWVCENKNIEYPGHDSSGKDDFGKSWRAVKQEFLGAIHRIAQAGCGIVFSSHSTEVEFKTATGDKFTRIFPSMSGQARKVVEAMVDLFFYAEYIRAPSGETKRIFICQGDDTIFAGARSTGIDIDIPRFLPMERVDGYDIIRRAFLGEDVGLDPKTLMPSKITSKVGVNFIRKAKTQTAIGVE